MSRRRPTSRTLLTLFLLLLLPSGLFAEEGKWVSLFNGKDLEGWTVKIRHQKPGVNWKDTFRVEDGILKVSYDQYEKFDEIFGHLFYNETFSHYRLRVEYRFVGEQCPGGPGWAFRNNGLMLHGESPETMGIDQDFPASIEVQLLGGNGKDKRSTANLCTPGTNVVKDGKLFLPHCTSSNSQTYHGDQWVTMEVEVRGDGKIKHILDGKTVLEYEQPQLDDRDAHSRKLIDMTGGEKLLSGGTISLQAESHPTEFRKIEIMVLDPEQP
ncbi:MAG: DUF1080 domain-containing protein [Pirellulaceae bacterium]